MRKPKSSNFYIGFPGELLHRTLFAMAAAHAYHIAQNRHSWMGIKGLNGIEINDPKRRLYSAMMGIAERKFSKDDLAALLSELAEGGRKNAPKAHESAQKSGQLNQTNNRTINLRAKEALLKQMSFESRRARKFTVRLPCEGRYLLSDPVGSFSRGI